MNTLLAKRYVLLANNPIKEGVEAVGIFISKEEAQEFIDGQGGDWRVIEVTLWEGS